MTGRIARGVAALAALAGLGGCSSKADVSGKVTHNGKALASGSVSLFARDNIQYSGAIKADGTYSIPNVPTGPVKILVTSPNPDASARNAKAKSRGGEGDLAGGAAGGAAGGWFPIPERYGDPATTDLTAEVKSNAEVVNIDLK